MGLGEPRSLMDDRFKTSCGGVEIAGTHGLRGIGKLRSGGIGLRPEHCRTGEQSATKNYS